MQMSEWGKGEADCMILNGGLSCSHSFRVRNKRWGEGPDAKACYKQMPTVRKD